VSPNYAFCFVQDCNLFAAFACVVVPRQSQQLSAYEQDLSVKVPAAAPCMPAGSPAAGAWLEPTPAEIHAVNDVQDFNLRIALCCLLCSAGCRIVSSPAHVTELSAVTHYSVYTKRSALKAIRKALAGMITPTKG
jgi:hypothetical protein